MFLIIGGYVYFLPLVSIIASIISLIFAIRAGKAGKAGYRETLRTAGLALSWIALVDSSLLFGSCTTCGIAFDSYIQENPDWISAYP